MRRHTDGQRAIDDRIHRLPNFKVQSATNRPGSAHPANIAIQRAEFRPRVDVRKDPPGQLRIGFGEHHIFNSNQLSEYVRRQVRQEAATGRPQFIIHGTHYHLIMNFDRTAKRRELQLQSSKGPDASPIAVDREFPRRPRRFQGGGCKDFIQYNVDTVNIIFIFF